MKIDNQRIWITGASSGIGAELVQQTAGKATLIIISGRDRKKLEILKNSLDISKTEIFVLPFNLEDEQAVEEAAKTVIDNFNGVDILINNGGISQRGWVTETKEIVDKTIMQINFFSQVKLTKMMLPAMIAQEYGHIVVTSSIVGKFGFPLRSAYAASKHALHGFFETLGLELASSGIKSTIICPGRVKTNISLNALNAEGKTYGKMDRGQAEGMSAARCARKYISAIEKNQWEAYIGNKEILMIWLKRYMPGIFRKIAMKISNK
ncbi:MAG: SDR family oxidoreductase [Bacteroidales bacterium]|nr:SDR family oxidoreductase [Bacteroidales bacterium]